MEHLVLLLDSNLKDQSIIYTIIKTLILYQQSPFALFDVLLMTPKGQIPLTSNYRLDPSDSTKVFHFFADVVSDLQQTYQQQDGVIDLGQALCQALCLFNPRRSYCLFS